jgi:hypothetical protein
MTGKKKKLEVIIIKFKIKNYIKDIFIHICKKELIKKKIIKLIEKIS